MSRRSHFTTHTLQNAVLLNIAEGRADRYAVLAAAGEAGALVRACYQGAERAHVNQIIDRKLEGLEGAARIAFYERLAAALRLRAYPELAALRRLVVKVQRLAQRAGENPAACIAEAKVVDTPEESAALLADQAARLEAKLRVRAAGVPQPAGDTGDAPRRWFLARVVNPAPIDCPAIRRGWEYPVHRVNGVYWIVNPDTNTGTILSADAAARALRSVRNPAGALVYCSAAAARAADDVAFRLGLG